MTHQFLSLPLFHCLSTTAKGLYANVLFEFSHYAFGGVGAWYSSRTRYPTSTLGLSRRVPPPRGSRLAPLYQGPPFSVYSSSFSFTRLLLILRVAAGGSNGIRHPFLLKFLFFVSFSYPRGLLLPGRPDVFSRARLSTFSRSLFFSLPF